MKTILYIYYRSSRIYFSIDEEVKKSVWVDSLYKANSFYNFSKWVGVKEIALK